MKFVIAVWASASPHSAGVLDLTDSPDQREDQSRVEHSVDREPDPNRFVREKDVGGVGPNAGLGCSCDPVHARDETVV